MVALGCTSKNPTQKMAFIGTSIKGLFKKTASSFLLLELSFLEHRLPWRVS
jgi:hypothetical protein